MAAGPRPAAVAEGRRRRGRRSPAHELAARALSRVRAVDAVTGGGVEIMGGGVIAAGAGLYRPGPGREGHDGGGRGRCQRSDRRAGERIGGSKRADGAPAPRGSVCGAGRPIAFVGRRPAAGRGGRRPRHLARPAPRAGSPASCRASGRAWRRGESGNSSEGRIEPGGPGRGHLDRQRARRAGAAGLCGRPAH